MRIAEAAAHTGVSARSLRHYEHQGLVEPGRDERGWRVYDEGDLARVQEIRALVQAGLPISAIRRLVGCLMTDGSSQPVQISEDLISELAAVRDRLDSRIGCLTRNRDALERWLEIATTNDPQNDAGRAPAGIADRPDLSPESGSLREAPSEGHHR